MKRIPFLLGLALLAGDLSQAQGEPWKFLVYGDSRGTSSNAPVNVTALTELMRATTNAKPAFVLVPGDLVYAGSAWTFQQWTNLMAPVYQAGIGVYPIIGNHDSSDVNAFKAAFGATLPNNGPTGEIDRTYAVYYSNVLVVAFDNYISGQTHQVNTNWLKAVLATNSQLHVFAMAHEPAFKANHTDCLDDVPGARDVFWNILSNSACRAYFVGHDHFYDHARLDDRDGDPSNDVHQYIVGTAGAPYYNGFAYNGVNDGWLPTSVKHEENNWGYVEVAIDGPTATLTWYHRTAANVYQPTADVFTYSLAPVVSSTYSNGSLRLTWLGGGRLQTAPAPAGPWTTLPNGTSPFVKTSFSTDQEFYRVKLR